MTEAQQHLQTWARSLETLGHGPAVPPRHQTSTPIRRVFETIGRAHAGAPLPIITRPR